MKILYHHWDKSIIAGNPLIIILHHGSPRGCINLIFNVVQTTFAYFITDLSSGTKTKATTKLYCLYQMTIFQYTRFLFLIYKVMAGLKFQILPLLCWVATGTCVRFFLAHCCCFLLASVVSLGMHSSGVSQRFYYMLYVDFRWLSSHPCSYHLSRVFSHNFQLHRQPQTPSCRNPSCHKNVAFCLSSNYLVLHRQSSVPRREVIEMWISSRFHLLPIPQKFSALGALSALTQFYIFFNRICIIICAKINSF